MNRSLSSGAAMGLAMIGIFSCSDNSVTGPDGLNSDDLTADAYRVASVTVSLASTSIAVGDTLRATAVLRDYHNRLVDRVVTWTSSDVAVASVTSSGLVTGLGAGTAVITATRGYKSGSATITVTAVASTGDSPEPVASVKVSLAASSLQPGQTTQATATTYDSSNNVLTGRAVTWSSSNSGVSTVSASGVVTAVAVGSASITASSEGKTGSAAISVAAAAPVPVASVTVSPASAAMTFGSTLQLTATVRDANNNVLSGRVVTWTSSNTTNAVVTATGLVSTVSNGDATITATSEGKSGSSTISISTAPPPPDTTTPPPPPPSGTGGWRANEPSGMTMVHERSFNSLNEDPAWGSLSSPSATIASDASAPKSPSSVLRINYPAGFPGGSAPEYTSTSVPSYRVLYFCYWVKHSSNWQGHITGISKHGYVWMGNSPLFVYEAEGSGSNPLRTRMALQGVVSQPNSDGWYGQNLAPNATFTRGQWDYVEILLTGNTSGRNDGAMDVYLNNVHVSHWTGIQYSSGVTEWGLFRIYPVWGGIGDVVQSDQYIQWDHIYISGKN